MRFTIHYAACVTDKLLSAAVQKLAAKSCLLDHVQDILVRNMPNREFPGTAEQVSIHLNMIARSLFQRKRYHSEQVFRDQVLRTTVSQRELDTLETLILLSKSWVTVVPNADGSVKALEIVPATFETILPCQLGSDNQLRPVVKTTPVPMRLPMPAVLQEYLDRSHQEVISQLKAIKDFVQGSAGQMIFKSISKAIRESNPQESPGKQPTNQSAEDGKFQIPADEVQQWLSDMQKYVTENAGKPDFKTFPIDSITPDTKDDQPLESPPDCVSPKQTPQEPAVKDDVLKPVGYVDISNYKYIDYVTVVYAADLPRVNWAIYRNDERLTIIPDERALDSDHSIRWDKTQIMRCIPPDRDSLTVIRTIRIPDGALDKHGRELPNTLTELSQFCSEEICRESWSDAIVATRLKS